MSIAGGLGSQRPGSAPDLGAILLSEETVRGLLGIVVDLASSSVPGVDDASVSLVVRGSERLETANASSETVRDLDQAQYQDGRGPCVEAIRRGTEVETRLPSERWPMFSESAVQAGVRTVHSVPLQVRDRTTGCLNLYSMSVDSLEGSALESARLLARQASIVLANASALMSAELANQHLQEALVSRDVIGQAKGVLMARRGLDADQAFDVLRRRSQHEGRKLRDIAAEVLGSIELPSDRH